MAQDLISHRMHPFLSRILGVIFKHADTADQLRDGDTLIPLIVMSSSTGADLGGSEYPMISMRSERHGHLCSTCSNFDLYSFSRDPFGFRGYKYRAAERAADEGCTFCSLLVGCSKDKLRGSSRSLAKGWEERWWIHLSLKGATKPQDIESGGDGLQVYGFRAALAAENYTVPYRRGWGWKRSPHSYIPLELHVVADSGKCSDYSRHGWAAVANLHISLFSDSLAARNKDVVGEYTGEHVLSDGNMRMLKTWLQNCLSHPKCCQTMSGGKRINARRAPLPTRCVEVLATGFRLRETGSKVGSYITLSHRWTTEADLCRTTADNIRSRRRKNADWSRGLPKTFLDTFNLARLLRVRYVWVDSLCIIQHGDNGVDWQQESLRMADYYQYSLLTIAATSGSIDDGLIPPKTILPPQLARLPYRDSNGSRHGFFYVYSYNWEVDKQYQSFIQESELLSRGWVFQEWLLSRRIVYFTPSGAFYECQEREPYNDRGEVASKTRPEGDGPAAVKQLAKNSFVFETASISRLWYQIVQSYSALLLTKLEKDRIVALAGIAKEFREAMTRAAPETGSVSVTVKCGLQYISGLWLRDLHHGLLWERKSSNLELQRIPQLPTWSWASMLCPVLWDDEHSTRIKPEAKVIAVATSQEDVFSIDSLQSFGSPPEKAFDVDNQSASLYIKGKMVQVLVWEKFTDERDLEIASATSGHRVDSAKSTWRTVCSGLLPTEIAGWASFEDPSYLGESLFQNGLKIYVLHISTISRLPGGYGLGYLTPWHDVFNVLFVKKVEGGKYERVGIGRLFGKEIEKQFCTATAQYVTLI